MDINKIISDLENKNSTQIINVKYLGGGSFGRVYKVAEKNGRISAVKVFLLEDMAQREALSLKMLSQNSIIKIPEVYSLNLKSEASPADYMHFEFIDGKDAFLTSLKKPFLSKKTKTEFADTVTDALLSIHEVKSDKFGPLDAPVYDSWLDYYRPFAENIYAQAQEKMKAGKFDGYIFEAMKEAYSRFDYIFTDEVKEACLIHGDLNVMNVLVDKRFKPIAFIDPLNSMYADREYDLFQFMNLSGNRFNLYETYKEKYKTSEKCDLKCAFYRLFNEAMCYLNTGKYTSSIMNSAISYLKQQLKLI